MTPIRDLVDGLSTDPDHSTRPGVAEQCVRGEYKHSTPVHPGFSFCRDCLAWLTEETDDDPLAAKPGPGDEGGHMTLSARYFADLGERAGRSFIQGFFGLWLANPNQPIEFDTLFTSSNLKAGIVMAALSIAMALVGKPIGNPDSASVLPPEAQPPAPQPVEHDAGYLTAAIYSQRLGRWSTVFLRAEATEDEGTFVLNSATRDGLPVAEYRPDRSGTHIPVGPEAMSELGLRAAAPPAPTPLPGAH